MTSTDGWDEVIISAEPVEEAEGAAAMSIAGHPLRRLGLWLLVAPCLFLYPLVWREFFSQHGGELDPAVFAIPYIYDSLLGFWMGLGLGSLRWRLLGGAAGIIYPAAMILLLLSIPTSDVPYFLIVFALPPLGIATAMFLVRRFWLRLCLLEQPLEQRPEEPFQFSMRTLMALVLAVAIVFGTARSCFTYRSPILLMVTVDLAAIIVAIAAVWAALRLGRPFPRFILAAVVALFLGLAPAFATQDRYAVWPMVMVFQLLGIVMPLLVVRLGGYRLVRPTDFSPPEEPAR